jgi:hypothetical protein
MSAPMLSALDWGVHISTVSDEWMIHSLPKARYSTDGGRVPGRLQRIMRAATRFGSYRVRFGSYRVECEGVLRGHKKPDYTTRSDSLCAEHYLSKLFRGGVAKSASRNTDTGRLTWEGRHDATPRWECCKRSMQMRMRKNFSNYHPRGRHLHDVTWLVIIIDVGDHHMWFYWSARSWTGTQLGNWLMTWHLLRSLSVLGRLL